MSFPINVKQFIGCVKTDKSILKLTEEDYNQNGMSELLISEGNYYDLNIKMFNRIQNTITGWPGGKPNADDSNRPERALPKKKDLLFSVPIPMTMSYQWEALLIGWLPKAMRYMWPTKPLETLLYLMTKH